MGIVSVTVETSTSSLFTYRLHDVARTTKEFEEFLAKVNTGGFMAKYEPGQQWTWTPPHKIVSIRYSWGEN